MWIAVSVRNGNLKLRIMGEKRVLLGSHFIDKIDMGCVESYYASKFSGTTERVIESIDADPHSDHNMLHTILRKKSRTFRRSQIILVDKT